MTTVTVLDGRYRLGALVGRGGMSDVYRALDQRTGEQVAVKIVRSTDAAMAARLAREARTLQKLDHPHLVRLLDSGVVDTRAYLVMTYVEGATLEARLRGGPLAPGATASLGAAVANALAYIHVRGIVHRDVKPANILITTVGRVKLADFGVARLADASALTVSGSTLGTVAYMAPEQLDNHQVGPSADVWSLGMVLLEALTGRRVYTGPPSEVIARRLAQPVPIPADLPQSWQDLLQTMLDRTPSQRPGAGDVVRQLHSAAFAAPWDPWGQPLSVPGTTTIPLATGASEHHDRTEVYRRADRPPASSGPAAPYRWRRAALAGLVALAAAGLIIWTADGGSEASKTTRAPTTSSPGSRPPNQPVQTAATELAALTRDVNAGVTAGSLASATGQALTNEARQAISAAGAGHRAAAATALENAAQTVSTGVQGGSMTTSEARLLQADLLALAAALGVSVTTTPPVTAGPAAPTTTPAPARQPQPPGHGHHAREKG